MAVRLSTINAGHALTLETFTDSFLLEAEKTPAGRIR
jgi:hypothetical protein